jgi:hypothetical protein
MSACLWLHEDDTLDPPTFLLFPGLIPRCHIMLSFLVDSRSRTVGGSWRLGITASHRVAPLFTCIWFRSYLKIRRDVSLDYFALVLFFVFTFYFSFSFFTVRGVELVCDVQ